MNSIIISNFYYTFSNKSNRLNQQFVIYFHAIFINCFLFIQQSKKFICYFSQFLLHFITEENYMSLTISTPDEICNAPYNNSTAKMQFSFPKDSRFKQNKQNADRPYYEVNGKHSNRTTNFGYGIKYDFTKDSPKTPPPTSYELKSTFQQSKLTKKGFVFGLSRQNMIVTGPLAQTINNKNPGPGSYEIPNTRNRCYYSMKGKRKQPQVQNTPGPGNYQIKPTLNRSGSNFFSRYRDHQGPKFSSSTQRFRKTISDCPGPGKYDYSATQMNSQGKYSLSNIHNSKVRRFGTAKRKSLNENKQTPGPGNYRLPSDFGYYVNKKAFLKQNFMNKKDDKTQKQNKAPINRQLIII